MAMGRVLLPRIINIKAKQPAILLERVAGALADASPPKNEIFFLVVDVNNIFGIINAFPLLPLLSVPLPVRSRHTCDLRLHGRAARHRHSNVTVVCRRRQ
jgi:hypothetical protein